MLANKSCTAKMEYVKRESFSEGYYDHRIRLARDIADTTRVYVTAIVEGRGYAQTTVSETEICIQEGREALQVRYITPDSNPAYQRLHRFSFGYGDSEYLSYLTTRLNSLGSPELLNSVEAIATDEAALSELAWISTAILSSHMAKRRNYLEE